jgi:hypothetical protein
LKFWLNLAYIGFKCFEKGFRFFPVAGLENLALERLWEFFLFCFFECFIA